MVIVKDIISKLIKKCRNKKTISNQPKEDFKETIRNGVFLKQPGDTSHNMNKSINNEIDNTELKRAIAEFKGARTLLNKALMRINYTGLGNTLYELDILISELKRKLK